jgi:acid phosphatase (class A)
MTKTRLWPFFAIICAVSIGGIAAGETSPTPARSAALGQGYLENEDLPDASLFIGPPPAPGSSAEAKDLELSAAARKSKGGPRWNEAILDADLMATDAASVMSCATGREISRRATPKTHKLLRRSLANLGMSTSAVKRRYQRPRPFMINGDSICTPDWDAVLRKDGSYPSGHSAIGYGWGLILAELVPSRAGEIVGRGIAYGDSRRFCNVHWASDVEAGRMAAAAVVARLHSNASFQKDMKAAKHELKNTKPLPPRRDCMAEAAALAMGQ